MPSIAIHSDIRISYRDSGKPQQDIYTTFVIIHGHTFHSNIMQHMFPPAFSKGVRLICPDRRDYCETTKFSQEENRVLAEGTEAEQTSFTEARGVEIATFLHRLIDELALPAPTNDRKDGGISLVGWSMGNLVSIGTIAAGSSMPPETLRLLQTYVKNFVMLSPAHLNLGFPGLPNVFTPIDDPYVPAEDRGRLFVEWASSYYTHGDTSTHDRAVLNTHTPDATPKSTVSRMAPEVFMSLVDFAPGLGSDGFLSDPGRFNTQKTNQLHKTAFDSREHSEFWPNLDVWVVYGDKEPWNVVYSAFEIEERSKAAGTNVKIHVIRGANHFVVWDDPQKAVDELLWILRN